MQISSGKEVCKAFAIINNVLFIFRCHADATPGTLVYLSESPLVLCGIVPTEWLHDNMAQVLLEKPDGGYGWSTKLGRSLTVPELRSLLILRYEVGC